MSKQPVVWTIAGIDSSGGAGIAADLLTFSNFNCHGCSVITVVTAQNSGIVNATSECTGEVVAAQIDTLQQQLRPAAIKCGVLGSVASIQYIGNYLTGYDGPIVYDPVLASSSGKSFVSAEILRSLKALIIPHVTLLTPNIIEAERLLNKKISTLADIRDAAYRLLQWGAKAVLLKGGHGSHRSSDFFVTAEYEFWITAETLAIKNVRGTGCTLSAAIAAAQAVGCGLTDAIVLAKMYLTQGIRLSSSDGFFVHQKLLDNPLNLPWITSKPTDVRYFFPSCGDLGFYPIVDSANKVKQLLAMGVMSIQLRIKTPASINLETEIAAAITVATAYPNSKLFINDHWKLAIKYRAYGVHLGQEDIIAADLGAICKAGLRLGISTHNFHELAIAHAHQPSYIAFGPIYPTLTKKMGIQPQGLERFKSWLHIVTCPVVAIGGIDLNNLDVVMAAGAKSVAVISVIAKSKNLLATVEQFQQRFSESR